MEDPANAPLVCFAVNFFEQLFSKPTSFCWRNFCRAAMSLWLGSDERSASSAGGSAGFPVGLNLTDRLRVFANSEDARGGENNFFEEADVKPYTEGETLVQLPTSMCLAFGHVQSCQIRPNNPPKQILHEQAAERGAQPSVPHPKVRAKEGQSTYLLSIAERILHLRRLSGANAVLQFMANIPLQLIETSGSAQTKQQVWLKKWSNKGTEKKMAKLIEEDIETAMHFLQSKASCKMPISPAPIITHSQIQLSESSTLKPPEPNAPL